MRLRRTLSDAVRRRRVLPLMIALRGLYLVTDRTQTAGRPLTEVVAAALRGGARLVQLRERDLPTRALLALATELRVLTRAAGAALLINDRVDIALACDADGVHLPGHSFAVADARALLGPHRLIGVSTHAPANAAAVRAAGADGVAVIRAVLAAADPAAAAAALADGA